MADVTLEGACKDYDGGVQAVKGLDLEIKNGELLVFVGPSGCGKSTTLRMIAGLEAISRGTICIGGRKVNDVPPKDRDIAMVFQNYALYPHMSVYDNMAFGLRLRKCAKEEIDRRVRQAAEILGIQDLLARLPKALSGGQRQRVAMGRAMVREPAVFLFDEPLSNLDAKMRVEMRKEILHLHQRINTTMIYVTHDQVEAMTLGDRIVVMKDGLVMQVAEPLVVYHDPANLFVARFIGTPPMNLIPGTTEQERAVFKSGSVRLPLPAAMHEAIKGRSGEKVYLGIRPEDLVMREEAESPQAILKGTVDVCERLGNETLIHLLVEGQALQIRVGSRQSPAPTGQELEVRPVLERAHIFDGTTGQNLTLPAHAVGSAPVHDLKAEDLLADVQHENAS